MMVIMLYNLIIELRVFDASTGSDPNEKPLINRLVNNRRWSVENSSKWITDEHEEGSYDYHFKELKDGKKHSK